MKWLRNLFKPREKIVYREVEKFVRRTYFVYELDVNRYSLTMYGKFFRLEDIDEMHERFVDEGNQIIEIKMHHRIFSRIRSESRNHQRLDLTDVMNVQSEFSIDGVKIVCAKIDDSRVRFGDDEVTMVITTIQ